MAPEAGATCLFFPTDEETLAYLRRTERSADEIGLVEAYCRAQGLWRGVGAEANAQFTDVIDFDLGGVGPSLAGPRRPDQHLTLSGAADVSRALSSEGSARMAGTTLRAGDVVLAAIASCRIPPTPTAWRLPACSPATPSRLDCRSSPG